jgi:uncharacterized protein (DUF2249 family)
MNNIQSNFSITPETKVGALLDKFPQLEEVLIKMAPEFKKLRNPVLRKTIAKVASLQQIAQLGNVPLAEMINKLRLKAGIKDELNDVEDKSIESTAPPAWFDKSRIVKTLDLRPMLEAGEQPVTKVLQELQELTHGQIYELIAPFLPAPLIDLAKNKGFEAWSIKEGTELVKIYFTQK